MVVTVATMLLDDLFPNRDPLYLVWLWRNVIEVWGTALAHAPATIGGLLILAALLAYIAFSKHSRIAIKLPSWVGTLPGIRHIRKWLGDKAMRRETLEEQSNEWVEEIIEIGQSKVAAEQWTSTQAKEWYAKFSRHFPILRYAALHDDTQGDLKEMIRERMRNEHRDVNGAIIPVPVP